MKKTVILVFVCMLSMVIMPASAMTTENNPAPKTVITEEIPAEVKILLDRIDEIKAMDKRGLERSERRALRKEVRAIKKNLRASGNGIYISSGAIIIILLLIIIL